MDDDPHPEHKLCGYLCTVLTSPSPGPTPLSPCHIISDGHRVFFKASNDVVLHPLASNSDNPEEEEEEEEAGEVEERSVRKKRRVPRGGKKGAGEMMKKKKKKKKKTTTRRVRGIGMVNGSLSVVHQVHSLLANRCLKVAARVLYVVEAGRAGGARVVVLVDVYLPIALWSEWQFPRSGSVAGALFRHLSCDWEKRRLMLVEGGEYFKNAEGRGDGNVWNISDCHVVGCKLNCGVPDPLKKRCFELHEIFKSLPSVTSRENFNSSRVFPVDNACGSGIWDLADDILLNILTALNPKDLVRVAASCKHLRSLAALIMPCMKLKLFPHQRAAVEWMLQRERNASLLPHPLYMGFSSEDGFSFYVNIVSGEIVTGEPPTIRDIRGGMFCDEPGLGKTITALSLILKTQGMMADPPDGAQVTWCMHNGDQRCGYYELRGDNAGYNFSTLGKKVRGQLLVDEFTTIDDLSLSSPERARLPDTVEQITRSNESSLSKGSKLLSASPSEPVARVVRCTRTLGRIRKNLLNAYEEASIINRKVGENSTKRKRVTWKDEVCGDASADFLVCNETWIQCDACQKWRKLRETAGEATSAWFCSMNTDTAHQSCEDPEEDWDNYESITCLPGFYAKGTSGGTEQNVSFFISVLKEHYLLINTNTKKALTWLAKLSPERLVLMETIGLPGPVVGPGSANGSGDACGFHTIFQAFGLTRKLEKGVSRWFYPQTLDNLALDLPALRIALCKPLDSVRLYLSRATLIVVPSNLVDHWRTQIQRHVKPGQLRICIWTDHRRPSVHSLAWDYDVVITTFNRLSTEWSLSKKGPLMQVHWLRVMLDEGHTLGSSINLTNKLQMAISLMASSRWLLTGTPTPNTPNSQLSHLQQLLMFLHEEAFGQNQKSWDAGILRPFEAEMEEGYSRLMQLLGRCLISARKADLKAIPPCIKKVTLLDFTEEHARSYNELVVTVRRNILMADWNDPSHVESLLNPKQWKFRSATIRNVRLSCCVAGHIKVQDAGQDIQETMDVFIAKGLDPLSEEYALIKYYLQHGGNCLRCKQWCRLPVVTPCRHLLCLDCVASDDEKCTLSGCGNLYEMQMPENLARPENPNPKWPVPKDLIELQPSYKQDDWDADWQSTSSSKVAYLVQRLKALQEANRNNGYNGDENSGAKTVGEQFCLSRVGNSSTLLQEDSCRSSGSCKMALEKVIIFSQFLEHIHVIAQQLAFADIKFAGLHSPMHTGNKMKSLATFQHDPTCMVLLMDGSAALGLDLSFVTHVFLMEPIWDRSIEEQVISRAHRMGATRPINVETLAMRGTIEEQMLEFLQDVDERRKLLKEEYVRSEREGARPPRSLHDFAERNYLARLSFVHTSPRA